MFVVDAFRKVTVSLGGRCALRCRHCYITAPGFQPAQPVTAEAIVADLLTQSDAIDIVCISGDTDPFLRESEAADLVEFIAYELHDVDIMITSRLVPSDAVFDRIVGAAAMLRSRGKVLMPGVSLVAQAVPNFSERSTMIPSTEHRLGLIGRYVSCGVPTAAALRPTFPFELVPQEDIDWILDQLDPSGVVVLGEVLLLDDGGAMAARLGVDGEGGGLGRLTFLDQETLFVRRTLDDEVAYVRAACASRGLSFSMRSVVGLDRIRAARRTEEGVALGSLAPGPLDDLDRVHP